MSDEGDDEGGSVCREDDLEFGATWEFDMRASEEGEPETRAYAPPMRWRRVTRVSCRNVRLRARGTGRDDDAISYTHLTLPTILLV